MIDNREFNWWIDPLMIPVVLLGFLVGYAWLTLLAGFAWAEYTFSPELFAKRYGKKP